MQSDGDKKLRIVLDDGAFAPTRAHTYDAGLDIYAAEDRVLWPNSRDIVETGVHVEIPRGYVGFLTSKSGLMRDYGVTTRGTIDSGYTGTIKVIVFNGGTDPLYISKGQKLSQLVIVPIITPEIEVVDKLQDTDRGSHGFGSTGR